MSGTTTFTILKPDSVKNGHAGKIIDQIIGAGFQIRAMKMLWMSEKTAGEFYAVHRERPFFNDLVSFMSSGPCVPMILEKENAVEDFRTLIGATDPQKAEEGTIRNLYAKTIDANAIHGADSDENAIREGKFFFSELEIF